MVSKFKPVSIAAASSIPSGLSCASLKLIAGKFKIEDSSVISEEDYEVENESELEDEDIEETEKTELKEEEDDDDAMAVCLIACLMACLLLQQYYHSIFTAISIGTRCYPASQSDNREWF